MKMLSNDEMLILTHLRKNARKSLAMIGRELNMPISTVFDKVHKINNSVVLKHTSLLDFAKLGHGLKINYVIKAKPDMETQLLQFLSENRKVNSVQRLKEANEFFVEAIFRDMVEFDSFTEALEEFKARNIHVAHISSQI
jgi:DNA-binding Lrp family transcriptional regulator